MFVFAYGSNMCEGRLRGRTPSARFVGVAQLPSHELRFHKVSIDGSAKADAFAVPDSESSVWGVVYEIDATEKPALDRAEGLGSGYVEKQIAVAGPEGTWNAVMYIAEPSAIREDLRPYTWYLRFVSEGARQHGLPDEYLAQIENQGTMEDRDEVRVEGEQSVPC